jgi:TetR/AcrR family macrolide resistance operon transcriptional repressor
MSITFSGVSNYMARPFTASDDDILLAARNVLTKRGPDGFSIKEVAKEVGLSRAAIILRFKSTHALKVASLEKMVQRFAAALELLPQTPSGDNLLRLAAFIGGHAGSRENSLRFFANYYSSNLHNRDLLNLEIKRGEALDAAISRVMPENALDRHSAVIAFRAHLSGTLMAWISLDDGDARPYLVRRTHEWLKLAGISFSQNVVEELLAPQVTKPAPMSAAPSRSKNPRDAKRPARRSKSKSG